MGPDYIANWILKDCACILGPPICSIYNSSLREGFIPTIWKSANVCPTLKINPPTRINKDLRPISLTPVLSKCLERFVCTWIMELASDFIDAQQHGAVKGISAVYALVELVQKWHQASETLGRMVRTLLLDFSKAFDRVDHKVLVSKMARLGLPNFLDDSWMTSFLTGRQRRVRLGEVTSDWAPVIAGVPQGTLIGPGLVTFLFDINDLHTDSDIVKYVDDSAIWEVFSDQGVGGKLQEAATQAAVWSSNSKMVLNCDKTKELRICFSRDQPRYEDIVVDGMRITNASDARLLGVTISDELRWQAHVDTIRTKAAQRLYFITLLKRASIDQQSLIRISTELLRSITEYACQLWHTGLTLEQSNQLESIQK